jgi:hypothetical protein
VLIIPGGNLTLTDERQLSQVRNVAIADQSVTAAKVTNNTITAGQIANNTITASQIANGTITSAQISGSAGISTGQIVDGILSADATGRAKMASGYIQTAHLGSSQIVESALGGGVLGIVHRQGLLGNTGWSQQGTGDIVVSGLKTRLQIGANRVVASSTAWASKSITFPVTFKYQPNVIACINSSDAEAWISAIEGISETGFTFAVYTKTGTANTASLDFNWWAIGEAN